MPDLKLFAIILFVAMYVLLVALPKFRPVVALAAAAIYVVSGVLPVDKVLTSIDWNVRFCTVLKGMPCFWQML